MSEHSLSFVRERFSPASKLILLSIVSIVLMMLDNRHAVVQQARSQMATILHPLQWLANKPVDAFQNVSTFWQDRTRLMEENSRLKNENIRLQMESNQYQAQARELAELKTLHGLQEQGVQITVVAQVISNSKDPLADKLIIDKGSRDGVKAGDPVLDQFGLIGQITQVQPFSAELTLVTDKRFTIPVMVVRTGVRSLLYGTGNRLDLRYFPTDADLQAGDILITSGLDSVYPAGIPVAKIESVQRASGTPYYRTTLLPLAAVNSSKYLMVLPQNQTMPSENSTPTPKTQASSVAR